MFLVDMAHIAGLVAGGAHPSPVPDADVVTSTTHKTLRGPRGGIHPVPAERCAKEHRQGRTSPGCRADPLMHVIAGKAVCFGEALRARVPGVRGAGGGQRQDPGRRSSPRAASTWCPGAPTTTCILVDLRSKGLTGKRAEEALEPAGITVNKNVVPFDPEKPFVTSGIRIGTAALTTRGFREEEMRRIARLIADVVEVPDDETVRRRAHAEASEMASVFPLYPELQ